MLDIQFIRDNPDLVKEKSAQKGYTIQIDELLEIDGQRKARQTQIDELRRRRNEIADSSKNQRPSDDQIILGKQLKEELGQLETDLKLIDEQYYGFLNAIPNVTQDDVPVGGEEDSVEIKVVGEKTSGAARSPRVCFESRLGRL